MLYRYELLDYTKYDPYDHSGHYDLEVTEWITTEKVENFEEIVEQAFEKVKDMPVEIGMSKTGQIIVEITKQLKNILWEPPKTPEIQDEETVDIDLKEKEGYTSEWIW